ncbi:MAG: anti-sigma factor family protein [Longimicrobiales bacterium]
MRGQNCDGVRDVLPEWTLGALDAEVAEEVRKHLSACPDCAEEEEVLRALMASRPEPPADLEARIQARVRDEFRGSGVGKVPSGDAGVIPLFRPSRWAPAWALSAAAVVILSLGIGVIWSGGEGPETFQDPDRVAAEEPLPESWLWDDGLVAGAPVYDGLTDEQLEALIQELEG